MADICVASAIQAMELAYVKVRSSWKPNQAHNIYPGDQSHNFTFVIHET